MTAEAEQLAQRMWATARSEEQCVRVVPDDALASEVRAGVRRLARADRVPVRTARLDATVVVVRLDAAVWRESTATMRRKLAPAADGS
ncbi:hypothetical protein [uncultured Amnibacterium sp.]|uniref:hypothetical protein n=1 Tax=uncultured Amnibacterium sp. TaxID=1631851 RepID=UPI0035CC9ECE